MLGWIFNISIISLLIILIFHYVFDFFGPTKTINNLVDLKVQKYKTIIDTLTQECLKQKEKNDYEELAKVYEAETGMPLSTDNSSDFEDLELYLNSKIDKS